MQLILHSVQKATKKKVGCVRNKLVSEFCLEFGISERLVKEYLKIFLDSEHFFEDEHGLIWARKK